MNPSGLRQQAPLVGLRPWRKALATGPRFDHHAIHAEVVVCHEAQPFGHMAVRCWSIRTQYSYLAGGCWR